MADLDLCNIQIYVSHRIDIDSELVDNPLYVHMRCGAAFDGENPMGIAGDDTGDNISSLRMSFCEFTVQYWAWKNAQADYYGLCHYRRYLSFAEKHFKTADYNMIFEPGLTLRAKHRFGLLDGERMARDIQAYDIVTSEYADVNEIITPLGKKSTVREMWEAYDGVFFEKSSIDLMFELIDELAPMYSRSAREYFAGDRHRGFNCYVMKKELFYRLCEFQFPIMFEAARRIDTAGYTQTMLRTPAFIGEMLYGIFVYHISRFEHWHIQERQLVFFRDTARAHSAAEEVWRDASYAADSALRHVVDPILPKGTRRREAVKDVFYTIAPELRRGEAKIKAEEKRNGC